MEVTGELNDLLPSSAEKNVHLGFVMILCCRGCGVCRRLIVFVNDLSK